MKFQIRFFMSLRRIHRTKSHSWQNDSKKQWRLCEKIVRLNWIGRILGKLCLTRFKAYWVCYSGLIVSQTIALKVSPVSQLTESDTIDHLYVDYSYYNLLLKPVFRFNVFKTSLISRIKCLLLWKSSIIFMDNN